MLPNPNPHFHTFSPTDKYLINDFTHTLLEISTIKLVLISLVIYAMGTTFFACWWYMIGEAEGDPCDVGISNFTDAYYFSVITISTIGYGANSTFFNSCHAVSILITLEAMFGLVMNAFIVGVIW
jgi:hypothetical protein